MVSSKEDFIKTFLPDSIKQVTYAQLDLDISDLSLADILRNVNTIYPKNSRIRNAIKSGNVAVGILCKTETIEPLSGLLLIITGDEVDIEIVSKNYIVIGISESRIVNDDEIKIVVDRITKYLISSFKDSLEDFNSFYVKYIYDAYEMEQNEENY